MTLVTDWKLPGTVLDLGGPCTAWTNPDNAKVEDGQGATALVPKTEMTCYLVLFNYGFTTDDLPENATVIGVELAVKRRTNLVHAALDSGIYLKIEESEADPPGDDLASLTFWPILFTWIIYGATANLWGIPELDGDIVRSQWFGNYLRAINIDAESDLYAYVDVTKIRVFYTVPEVAAAIKGIRLSKRLSID